MDMAMDQVARFPETPCCFCSNNTVFKKSQKEPSFIQKRWVHHCSDKPLCSCGFKRVVTETAQGFDGCNQETAAALGETLPL